MSIQQKINSVCNQKGWDIITKKNFTSWLYHYYAKSLPNISVEEMLQLASQYKSV